MPKTHKVVVTGDVTIDWNLARSPITTITGALWDPNFKSKCYRQDGGAALLGNIIAKTCKDRGHTIKKIVLNERETQRPGCEGVSHSYTICKGYKGKEDKDPPIWRVDEFLGVEEAEGPLSCGIALEDDIEDADLVIVDDANQGFRKEGNKGRWPASLLNPNPSTWVILKMAHLDFENNDLLKHILDKFENRIVLVLTVNDLRVKELRISRELSWERSISDLVEEIRNKYDQVKEIPLCVVSFYTEGAAIIKKEKNGDPVVTLIYDPSSIEGSWQPSGQGRMVGYTQCLTAGIVDNFLERDNFESIHEGVERGLMASRKLHERGFLTKDSDDAYDLPASLQFPDEDIARFLQKVSMTDKERGDITGFLKKVGVTDEERENVAEFLKKVGVTDEESKDIKGLLKKIGATNKERSEFSMIDSISNASLPEWSILQLKYSQKEVLQLVCGIVSKGYENTLEDVPIAKFGDFVTMDKDEMEGMRQVRMLMQEYRQSSSEKKPLSIAVFGDPGSGKSFAVESLAKSLDRSKNDKIVLRQFNLSQFSDHRELIDAFHQVRDEVLKGTVPLIFWDEFDTSLGEQQLGWLRYFLAPMQDGTFQHGQVTHSIGKAIFIFGGGVFHTVEKFESGLMDEKENRKVKHTDFVSRLKGFAGIRGLDHPDPGTKSTTADPLCPLVMIRRALILRSVLMKFAPGLVQKRGKEERIHVDDGIIRAFMGVRKFKHGVRSLESIIRMSFLTNKHSFDRSSLPADPQLRLHVNEKEFLAYLKTTDVPLVERIEWRKCS
jgi:hypothetical protein